MKRLLALEFSRLVPAHGVIVDGPDTHARVAAALRWMHG